MPERITRRDFAVGMATAMAVPGIAARAPTVDKQALRFILKSDLHVLHPIWTTTYATRPVRGLGTQERPGQLRLEFFRSSAITRPAAAG
jgi:hypothetical protein